MEVARVKQIYEQMEKYAITLSSDPASLGPKYLMEQIATCRDYINNVSHILMEVHREKQNLAGEVRTQETLLAVESNDLLTNDKRIRDLPNIKDREAAIALLLRARVQTIADLKARVGDLDYMEKAVRHRHHELRDTMAEIKLQRSLIRDELDTKSFYGGERDTPEPGDEVEGADIEALLEAAQSERKAAQAKFDPPPAPAREEQPSTEGMFCGACGEPQFNCPGGLVCKNGHGGAPTVTKDEAEAIQYMADLDDKPAAFPAATPPVAAPDEDAAIADFLAEGDDVGAPKNVIVADDYSDILDTI